MWNVILNYPENDSGSNGIPIKYLSFQLNTSLSLMELKQLLTSRNIVGLVAEKLFNFMLQVLGVKITRGSFFPHLALVRAGD